MFKVSTSLRRSAAVVAVVFATFLASGTGAQAASISDMANGIADSQALHIKLTLPDLAQLQSTLSSVLDVPVSQLPAMPAQVSSLLSSITNLDEVVSLNHGEVMHGVQNTVNHALGFANPLTGTLDPVLKQLGLGGTAVSSSCSANGGCTSSNGLSAAAVNGVADASKPVTITLPQGLGVIKLAGAQSTTSNLLDTKNLTGLIDVKLGLSGLFGPSGLLAPVGSALSTLTDTVNSTVIPAVDGVISQVKSGLDTVLSNDQLAPVLAPVKSELDKFITIGDSLKELPDLSTADLLDLSVLTANADVAKAAGKSGALGILSQSASKIANLDILKTASGSWAHVDAINLATKAFADGVKADSIATASQSVTGGNIGGLLGLHVANQDLADLLNGTALQTTLAKVFSAANLDPSIASALTGAVNMLNNIAGIKVENVGTHVDKTATSATAKAGTLLITVAPQIPVLGDVLKQIQAGAVPDLTKVKYVSSGINLSLELPNSAAYSAMGKVLPVNFPTPKARTGVGTPFAVAFVMIGAAILVRRFALAK